MSTCDTLHASNETRLTSLSDIKFRSFFHNYSFISFVQFGLELHGFTRYLPFTGISTKDNNPSNPTSCNIDLPTTYTNSKCYSEYHNSLCDSTSKNSPKKYPSYDPRCRSWYLLGNASTDYNDVIYQKPRSASSGIFVQTGILPIRSKGAFVGVLNTNYLATRLSRVINSIGILFSGYCYLIDTNSSALITHPAINSTCNTIDCVEGFSQSEYDAFAKSVLQPIRAKGTLLTDSVIYTKKGISWRLTASTIQIGTIHYAVFATVPNREVEKTAVDTTNAINSTIIEMEIAFAIAIFGFFVILMSFSWKMIGVIVNPVNDLRAVFALVRNDDLSGSIPSQATSRDMKILLDAFSKV